MTAHSTASTHGFRTRSGFTIVELLVVIAVIGVLVGILLPAMGRARRLAAKTRETAAGQSLIQAYQLYTHEHKDTLLPGYLPLSWISDVPVAGLPNFVVLDERGERVSGVPAARYPWRLAPYLNYDFRGLYKDEKVLQRYQERSDFQYVVSLSPSFGLNSMFIGGDADHFGFNPAVLANPKIKSFYLTNLSQAQRPSELVTFGSAHGVNPDGGELVPGYFRIEPPFSISRTWSPQLDRSLLPRQSGNLDFRHDNKAAVAFLDGHASTLSFAQLDDMRHWSDKAPRADWALGTE